MQHEFSGLRTVIYKVPDLDKAKKWYSEVFDTEPYFDMPFYVGFTIAGYELGLQPVEKEFPAAENVETYWAVGEVEKSYARLLSLGATAHHAPQDVGESIVVATVRDPWNNIIGLIHNPHFKLP